MCFWLWGAGPPRVIRGKEARLTELKKEWGNGNILEGWGEDGNGQKNRVGWEGNFDWKILGLIWQLAPNMGA
jgi:hypothetical protein